MSLNCGRPVLARLILHLEFAVAFVAFNVAAQVSPTSPTTSWTAIVYGNNNNPDPFADQQTGGRKADIVGTSALPSFYKQFYDGGTPVNLVDGQLGFRLRLAEQNNPPGYTGGAFVGLEGDTDGTLDIFVGVNNQGSGDTVGIWGRRHRIEHLAQYNFHFKPAPLHLHRNCGEL